ncbi:MAG: DUF512 domain-containing protein [Candidatus Marinimicrobia bacterium]|nr:DUF512 domain-containing protein [Candidatus Neomarinimicrobiota bacterium]MBL7023634.1 DUF512 domain-containing protein [Candidatus Neomarinimicrobiota bacterium]MBL7109821.1 DUF512 domain-containing protein [Candidatus Neomarinimicrobiota bacterium]
MKIIKTYTDSLGEMIGLKPGDHLLKIDGKKVRDDIDYKFRITEENLTLEVQIDGENQIIEIEKEYDDDLGVEFEEFKIRMCANNCVFCFSAQNPNGMRKSLYFKDGDYRLSYLHGHYITLTNMGKNDLARVVEQRLSPLYISVHSTEPKLRKNLFLYGKDDHLLEKIKYLAENGIEMHTQIVLIPNENDGIHLNRTLDDLYQYYPQIKSVSIVPVGLTKHRENLMQINSVDKKYAENMMNLSQEFQQKYRTENHQPFLLFSDEWYILANKQFPKRYDFGDIDLVENGVGQVSKFIDRFEKEKSSLPKSFSKPTEFTIFTGTLVNDIFNKEVGEYLNSITNLTVNITPIINDFYGHSVTVTGLLTGQDIISQLENRRLGESVWSTYRILNDDGNKTLDNVTLENMSSQLGVPVNVCQDSILEIFERNIIG